MSLRNRRGAAFAAAVGVAACASALHLSNPPKNGIRGRWTVVSVWSQEDYLPRMNIREGADIVVEKNGYVQIGQLGIDGIVGTPRPLTGVRVLKVNGSGQTFAIEIGGKRKEVMIMTSTREPAVIVARRPSV